MSTVTFLGLPMSKAKKIWMIIGILVAFVCLVVYIATGIVSPTQETVILPSGGLSKSIFDVQNMTYKKQENLKKKHQFAELPFSMDVLDAQSVMVGDATIYASDPYYFLVDVIGENDSVPDAVKKDLTSIISLDANESATAVNVLVEEEGYINGCAATYYVYEILVETAKNPFYLSLYALNIDESIYQNENTILIGCMAQGYQTQMLSNCNQLANLEVYTLQYDKSRAKEFEKQEATE